ncbi:MAG: IclR family transcriptional regulator [Chloroflexota bacterium]
MTIQSLERAFSILKTIDASSTAIRPAEIAEHIDLPRTTVIRMLGTLEALGAVTRAEDGRNFLIGPTIQAMAQSKPKHRILKQIARPYLEGLANSTGETVYLCTQSHDQVYYLDQIDSRHHILLRNWVGSYFPLHTTAAGKLFLAFLPDEELTAYLTPPLEALTDKTVTNPAAIRHYVAEIRQDGCAWTNEQTEEGLIGVAAPIYQGVGQLVAAVSLGGPAFRFPPKGKDQAMAQQVIKTAQKISQKL